MIADKLKNGRIAVIGVGYVGLPVAVEFGKHREVLGFDINSARINQLVAGTDTTQECTKEELKAAVNLRFSHDECELKNCSIFIITVPTPVDDAKKPDLEPLVRATETVGKYLSRGSLVIYESTVFPGATEEVCIPILERVSGFQINADFFCGYSPERINPGDRENTFTSIVKVTSGSCPEAADAVDRLYSDVVTAGTWKASSIKVAEAAKVVENTQRDVNIAFTNELSKTFEKLGIDTIEVLEAAGTKWNFLPFRPGMVGGHCIGVDPYYLAFRAEQAGYQPQLILAGRRLNDGMSKYAARNIIKKMLKSGVDVARCKIGLLGVTFKENCPDIRNSKIFEMIEEFEDWGVTVWAVDPWANSKEVHEAYDVKLLESLPASGCDAIVVAVGHQQFRDLQPIDFLSWCVDPNNVVLGDLKSIYSKQACEDLGFNVFRL